ncbi:galactose-3-O-sulfotransferase 2-like isoform X2 [Daphnia pulex]|uniref:galactose-3-O-sulfotransferase 2-like isoform X2 n=1 Tax=Daphnia pulex TaxID=6669 RepID=UPI001EDDC33B|nr:galactose-3-O-sulfotransferase 2-like isoform X2 [Daphnia pulex]
MHNHPSLSKRCFSKWFVAVLSISCFLVVLTIHQNSEQLQISTPQELRKFAFMRNHKCASTTVENTIFRFAHKNNLNLVLPNGGNYLSTTELFNHSSLDATKWKNVEFDIFSLHNRWNKKEVMTLLREEVPAFTIVRDPVQVFESMFHFLDPKLHKFYGVKDIHDMIRIIQSRSPVTHQALSRRMNGMIGRNQMAWDMGLSPEIFDDDIAITEEIERLDREFDLVMVANRMEESLVLLKHLLNWPLENVVHLNLNRRKPEKSSVLSVEERKVLSDWLAADGRIYEHFSRRFEERVAEFNRKHSTMPAFLAGLFGLDSAMEREKQLLEEANKKLYGTCVVQELGNEKLSGVFKEYNNNIMGFDVNRNHEWCAFYAMSEPAYLKIFQDLLLSRAMNQ